MKTPRNYLSLIKNGIITEEILSESIYSLSKRAKHHRDMEQWYRNDERLRRKLNHFYYDKYNNADNAASKKLHYYHQKDILLELLAPSAIHTSNHLDGTYGIYLFYIYGNHSFHRPIKMVIGNKDEYDTILGNITKEYPELEVMEIPDLLIPACDLTDILSVQFTDKVVALVESGDYTLIHNK